MDRFGKIREYGGGVNRNVWLVLGVVVIIGLVAATFIYGRTNDDANQTAGGETAGQEQAADGAVDEQAAAEQEAAGGQNENAESAEGQAADEGGENSAATAEDGSQATPGRGGNTAGDPDTLADTGAESVPLAVAVIGGSGYLWQRSRRQLLAKQTASV